MNLSKFEIFHEVVKLGSLTKAGDSLGFTQSAVSQAISSLEREFGFPLLLRDRSGISLTSNGERTLTYVREMLRWYEQMKQEVAAINGLKAGIVRVGSFPSITKLWLPGIIDQFSSKHPYIEVGIQEGSHAEIEQWIAEGTIDLGLVSLPMAESLRTIPLQQDRMLCVLPDQHSLRTADVIQLQQLENEPFIMPKAGWDDNLWRIFQQHHVEPKVTFELGDDEAIIELVRKGLGVSILPEMSLSRLRSKVSAIRLQGNPVRTLGIAIHSWKCSSPATLKFIDCTKSWLNHPLVQAN